MGFSHVVMMMHKEGAISNGGQEVKMENASTDNDTRFSFGHNF